MNAVEMIQMSDDEEDEDLISLMPASLGSISSLLGPSPNGSGNGSRLEKLLLHRQRQNRRKGTGRVTRPLNLSFKKKTVEPMRDRLGLQDVAAFWASEDRKEAEGQKQNAMPRLSRSRSKKSDRPSKLDTGFLTKFDNEKLVEEEVEAPPTFIDKSGPAVNRMLSNCVRPESLNNALEAYKKALMSMLEPTAFNFQRATAFPLPQETVKDSTRVDNAERHHQHDDSSPQTKRNSDVPTSSGHNGSEDKAAVSADSAKSSVVSSPFPASLRRKTIDLERKRLSFDQIPLSPQANEVGDSDMTVSLPEHIPKRQLDALEVQSGHTAVIQERSSEMEIDDTHDSPTSNHTVMDIAAQVNVRQEHVQEEMDTEVNIPQDLEPRSVDIQETAPQENEMQENEDIPAEENAVEETEEEQQKDAKGDAGETACENRAENFTREEAEDIVKKNAKPNRKSKRKANTQTSPWMTDAGSKWEDGKRCSRRYRSRPLEWWRGEKLLYGRIHKALTTVIGVKHSSPLPPKPKIADYKKEFKVDSFVSEQYEDLVKFAAL